MQHIIKLPTMDVLQRILDDAGDGILDHYNVPDRVENAIPYVKDKIRHGIVDLIQTANMVAKQNRPFSREMKQELTTAVHAVLHDRDDGLPGEYAQCEGHDAMDPEQLAAEEHMLDRILQLPPSPLDVYDRSETSSIDTAIGAGHPGRYLH